MGNNNIVRFFHNKYVFLAVNGILFLAAVVSLFAFGTIQKAYPLMKETSSDMADITLISVYIIVGVLSLLGIILTVKGFMTKNEGCLTVFMYFGTLMFTWLHIISAHISSSAMITSLVKGHIDIPYIVSNCPVFEMIFMAAGIIFMLMYLIIKALIKTTGHTENGKEAVI